MTEIIRMNNTDKTINKLLDSELIDEELATAIKNSVNSDIKKSVQLSKKAIGNGKGQKNLKELANKNRIVK
ncbi:MULTISPECIES: hypothetical protein [Staphylococcus]|uniref:Uncharacterized protein n=1 Tax=Staphylococcus hsinchuensis TaxID=3051183 RepID=A0ABZ3EEL3_9STAP|nr:hypothetical protein [Staphylococcus sp. Marseille-Q6910]